MRKKYFYGKRIKSTRPPLHKPTSHKTPAKHASNAKKVEGTFEIMPDTGAETSVEDDLRRSVIGDNVIEPKSKPKQAEVAEEEVVDQRIGIISDLIEHSKVAVIGLKSGFHYVFKFMGIDFADDEATLEVLDLSVLEPVHISMNDIMYMEVLDLQFEHHVDDDKEYSDETI